MSEYQLMEELYTLFSKEIENNDQRYTDTIYDEVVKNKNIIEELEKYIKEMPNNEYFGYLKQDLLDKLRELKEGKQ